MTHQHIPVAPDGKVVCLTCGEPLVSSDIAVNTTLQLATYNGMLVYRGVTSSGRVLYVLSESVDENPHVPLNADEWSESAGDGESCWYAAKCDACGAEFRPIDGYIDDDAMNIEFAYCRDCCHW
jgi:hypothetical protein